MNNHDFSILPNFLLVGAAKSGTTSLHKYLCQHPDVFMPKRKEPLFLMDHEYFNLHNIKSYNLYKSLFKKSNHKAIGEASVAYLYDKKSPQIIQKYLGNIKIIIILRDPVHSSYSLYNHQVRRNGETLNTFEEALQAEEKRRKSAIFKIKCYGYYALYYYYNFFLYSSQVERYLKTFGKKKVKIVLFDDFEKNPIDVTQEIYRFLDVDETFVPEIKIYNRRGTILSMPHFWADYGLFMQTVSFLFSKNLFKKIPHLKRNIRRRPIGQLKPETEMLLRKRYQSDIIKLEALIERDLSKWKA